MHTLTREQFIQGLRDLADRMEEVPELDIPGWQQIYISTYEKDQLLAKVRQIGGAWRKSLSFGETEVALDSLTMPIRLSIPRDKVCKKTVTWDCEPMFSPQDEQELDAALIPNPEPLVQAQASALGDDDVPF